MEIKVLNESKESIEFSVDSVTIAEILRVYLNKDSAVTFAAWKREHQTESPIIKVETKGKAVKKAVADAVDLVTKELEVIETDFKKLK